ncbi:MAG: DMT family transporter [Anaerolineales bacterium]
MTLLTARIPAREVCDVEEAETPARWQGVLAVSVVMVIFGTTFVATEIVLEEMGPLTLAFGRFFIALIVFAPFLRHGRDGETSLWRMVCMGLLSVTLFFSLQNWGLLHTTSANAAIILSAIPALTAIVSRFALGEPLTLRRGLGILLSMAGVAVVVTGDALMGVTSPSTNTLLGDLLILGSALCWALYTVLGQQVVRRWTPGAVTAHTIAWGTLFLAPLAVGEVILRGVVWPTPKAWIMLLFLALIASGLAFFLYLFALTRLEAGDASVYVNLSPVVTLIAARLVLGDPIRWLQILGAALVLGGLYLTEKRSSRGGR